MRLEINGSDGSIAFDFEAMNELQFHDHTEDVETAGFRRILVTEPTHPYVDAWWPPGHGLGYEHTFTHEVVDLVRALGESRSPTPSFADGLQVQHVLAAVERSAEHSSSWEVVGDQPGPGRAAELSVAQRRRCGAVAVADSAAAPRQVGAPPRMGRPHRPSSMRKPDAPRSE